MKPYLKTGLIGSAVAVAVMAGAAAYTASHLPEGVQAPIHFGPDGAPDRFADRAEAVRFLWAMPGIGVLLSLFLAVVAHFEPRKANLEHGSRAYVTVWLGAMGVLTAAMIGICFAMLAWDGDANPSRLATRVIIASTAMLFILLGNVLPKTRSSFFLGLRTPWTLSSETVWQKTHRLAGRLYLIAGALGLVAAATLSGMWLGLTLPVLVMFSTLISAVYSWWVWRTADDRLTPNEIV